MANNPSSRRRGGPRHGAAPACLPARPHQAAQRRRSRATPQARRSVQPRQRGGGRYD